MTTRFTESQKGGLIRFSKESLLQKRLSLDDNSRCYFYIIIKLKGEFQFHIAQKLWLWHPCNTTSLDSNFNRTFTKSMKMTLQFEG